MKTIRLEIDPQFAQHFITQFEKLIAEKTTQCDELTKEIQTLQEGVRIAREQLNGSPGKGGRRPRGKNVSDIKTYLGTLPNNKGSSIIGIVKATGISVSSTSFTLKNNAKDFEFDKGEKVWKLKQ